MHIPKPITQIPKPQSVSAQPLILKASQLSVGALSPIEPACDLLSNDALQAPTELVSGLLHCGTKGVVAAGSKIGKTWLLVDLALSVATGTCFLGFKTRPAKVLYINLEIRREFIKARVAALMKARNISSAPNLHFWNLRGCVTDLESLVRQIIKAAKDEGYELIIIDPIYKVMVGRSENGAAGVGDLCAQLEQIPEQTGAAVVFAHHFTKGDARKKAAIDRMSGSGVFARDADTILTFTPHSEPGCYTAETILRNLPLQQPFVVEWRYPVMVLRNDLSPEQTEPEDEVVETGVTLLDLLTDGPLTTGQWEARAKEQGITRPTFFRHKAALVEEGALEFNDQTKTWSARQEESQYQSQKRETETNNTNNKL